MFVFNHQVRVRYGDTDQMGYVYYGNYAYYYEQARAEAIRSAGVSYKEIETSGTLMPIARMNIKYILPAYYDELLTIKTVIPHMPGRIIIFQYFITNEKEETINEGETHQVFLDTKSQKIKSAPDVIVNMLKPFFAGK